MSDKTHYRELEDNNFLGHWDLKEKETVVTITKVEQVKVFNPKKQEENIVTTIHLKDMKPMILNKVNKKSVSVALKSPFVEDWVDKQIVLYTIHGKFFGEETEAIRVKTTPPQQNTKKPLITGTEMWNKVVAHLKSESSKDFDNELLPRLKEKYVLSKQIIDQLKKEHAGNN